MNVPLVSVCVVTYNQEEYITKCLESIVSQETDFDFEIIISDDCSTDRTPDIIKNYANNFSSIKIIQRDKNLGALENFLSTHSFATGKYVCHIDGDDYWLPNKLKIQVAFMEKNPKCNISWHRVKVSYPDKRIVDDLFTKKIINGKYYRKDILQYIAIGVNSSKMYRRNTFFYPQVDIPITDYFLNVEQVGDNYAAFVGNEILGVYRAGIGIASDGNKTKIMLSKTFSYFKEKYPDLKSHIVAAALTLFLAALKNKRKENMKIFYKHLFSRKILIALFILIKKYSIIKNFKLP
ncbi:MULTISPECIES: glycosyltransferase family 2 protein [Photorhabdus]|uniref:Glycosyl transferase n=2 Tax=Photorhabdus asymbiotica TaxID=291112 RepID=C7BSC1_PHOAA|nr:glycosyltransferase [Photorhabdus asymbiotica]RKS60246.1 glycosyltransferase involved in cell wall biosynthesis [Photorhabdus asymbiotica]CAQ86419.1 putative glycosyl transferase [Photorhabdus asymbiotica]